MSKQVLIGNIAAPKGIRGEFQINGISSRITFLQNNLPVQLGFSENFSKKYKMSYFKIQAIGKAIAKIDGIDIREDIALLKDQGVFVDIDVILQDNPDFYLLDDIIGCKVIVEEDGSLLGTITEVWEMPANDVWLVETADGDLPLPVIDDVVLSVDTKSKIIKIHLMDGLMDLLSGQKEPDDED